MISDAGLQTEIVGTRALVAHSCRSLCIEIVSDWNRRYAVRRYIATLTATFRLRNESGSVASVRQHRVEATALTGHAEAEVAAVRASIRREIALKRDKNRTVRAKRKRNARYC